MTPPTTTPASILPAPLAAFVQSALTATEQAPVAATPVGAPLRRSALVGELATRSTANAVGTAQLLSENPDSDTIGELYAMQGAFVKQLWKINQDWRAGLLRIYEGSLLLRKANTLSKVVEQDYNLFGQYGDLVTNYVTSVTTLVDNSTVGYSYWLSKKIQAAHAAKAAAA
ncbi:hypothetical protein [Methylobacterium sp. 17Sr1-1]|uniref:hypothetical protein n=1 Tax=Methylobacterium sp. 17Sr1-1 TaxID=2202826 RepID=UPI000D6F2EF3|nr:hypothetical protein [Methylobacterium sp. 17Sr1-1]AWN51887.1 hypothetical protein DK412_09485 [Methylobacterium sp. 17Sr1-1]